VVLADHHGPERGYSMDDATCPECDAELTIEQLVANDWSCPECSFTPDILQ